MVFSRQVVYQESFILHSEELLLFKVVLKKRVIMSASLKGDNLFYPKFIFFVSASSDTTLSGAELCLCLKMQCLYILYVHVYIRTCQRVTSKIEVTVTLTFKIKVK